MSRSITLILVLALLANWGIAQDEHPPNSLRSNSRQPPSVNDQRIPKPDRSTMPINPSVEASEDKPAYVEAEQAADPPADQFFADPSNSNEQVQLTFEEGFLAGQLLTGREIQTSWNAPAPPRRTGINRLLAWIQEQQEANKKEQNKLIDNATVPLVETNALAETIRHDIEALKSDTQLDDAIKSERLKILNSGAEWLQKSKTFQRHLSDFKTNINGFDEAQQQVKNALQRLMASPILPAFDPEWKTEQLQREMQRVQSEVDTKKTELESLQNEMQRSTQRITEVPKQKSEAQQRLKKVLERIGEAGQQESNSSDETDLLQQAIRIGTEAEVEMLNLESRYLELTAQLSPMSIDLASKQLQQLEEQYNQFHAAAELTRQREVEQQIQLAREAVMKAHPRLADMADRNQELAEQRKVIAQRITDSGKETVKVTAQSKQVDAELTKLKKNVEEGQAQSNSLLLSETRRALISPLESKVRLHQIQTEMQKVNVMVDLLQSERELLSDAKSVTEKQLGVAFENADEHLKSMAQEFIETKRTLLNDLLNDYRSYKRHLVDTSVLREKLVQGISVTEELLEKHMLWVRSASPVSMITLKKSQQGASNFFCKFQWQDMGTRLISRVKTRLPDYMMFAFGFVVLLIVVKRLKE